MASILSWGKYASAFAKVTNLSENKYKMKNKIKLLSLDK